MITKQLASADEWSVVVVLPNKRLCPGFESLLELVIL